MSAILGMSAAPWPTRSATACAASCSPEPIPSGSRSAKRAGQTLRRKSSPRSQSLATAHAGRLARRQSRIAVSSSPRRRSEHVDGLLTPMRKQLELYALELAFPKLTPAHRGEWQVIIRRMQRAGEDQNVQEVLDHDAAFHQQLLIAAGLEDMIPVWQGIYARMRDYHRQGNREHAGSPRIVAHVHQPPGRQPVRWRSRAARSGLGLASGKRRVQQARQDLVAASSPAQPK